MHKTHSSSISIPILALVVAAHALAAGAVSALVPIGRPALAAAAALAAMITIAALVLRRILPQNHPNTPPRPRTESRSTRWSLMLEALDEGVLVLDVQHRLQEMNRAARRILDLPPSGGENRLIQEVVRSPELHRLASVGVSGSTADFTVRADTPRIVRAVRTDLQVDAGEPARILLLLTDVTRTRRLESMHSDFAANVSHELRTPITTIKGYTETLLELDWNAAPADARDFLRVIAASADRLGAIVEDMRTLTQLESASAAHALERQPARLDAVVASVVDSLERPARERSIRIVTDIAPNLVLTINAPLIERAISNLLENAIRYSPEGNSVTLRAFHREHDDTIEVIDHGPGIPPEHLERIFERFYRVDKGRTREKGGTGLGLAIARHIVELHLGRIDVDSTPGRGSTFRIHLPPAEPP